MMEDVSAISGAANGGIAGVVAVSAGAAAITPAPINAAVAVARGRVTAITVNSIFGT